MNVSSKPYILASPIELCGGGFDVDTSPIPYMVMVGIGAGVAEYETRCPE